MTSDPRVMLFEISEIICAEWLTVCRHITTRLGQIDWEIAHPDFRKDPTGIDSSLSKLHPWRRSVPQYKSTLDEAVMKLFPSGPVSDCIGSLREDFRVVEMAINELQNRIEQIVAIITATISIEESRRVINLNQYLGRLTYLAVIFAPLSFVSSFFSMASDLSLLQTTFWVYFCVAIPVSLVAFMAVDHARFTRGFNRIRSHFRSK